MQLQYVQGHHTQYASDSAIEARTCVLIITRENKDIGEYKKSHEISVSPARMLFQMVSKTFKINM